MDTCHDVEWAILMSKVPSKQCSFFLFYQYVDNSLIDDGGAKCCCLVIAVMALLFYISLAGLAATHRHWCLCTTYCTTV
ncbi:hypothetical protein TRIATDRAFT_301151 [Trichoderma atroviride IMI 206040]|uniref:Uncharacterized protein n=1 Tax=Hypocrea atroviridis (strain ATCC 20476 / IMI 206040) TaxID=452589 RepID=G9P115_HYPAI|nr:uncharacterized protein TRIATDRAFT_301151 [Trichoderma atroviride IMI 206040]EHK43260.1 hypothetical protein TRIATDRAFT_301151 [Trichoderma atroviride IMI 206040]